MRCLLYLVVLSLFSLPCFAQATQESHGACSPNIVTNMGPVTCIIQYGYSGSTRELKLVAMELPPNNVDLNDTQVIIDFFDQLQKLDGKIVYLRLYMYPGAGAGFNDVSKKSRVRAGILFDWQLNGKCKGGEDACSEFLDGFGGNRSEYGHAYRVELPDYRPEWGGDIKLKCCGNRASTLLFPKSGNAFFDVHYMKSFSLDGLAKIRISDMQGFQWIEIVPAQPFGSLLEKYDEILEKLPKGIRHEF